LAPALANAENIISDIGQYAANSVGKAILLANITRQDSRYVVAARHYLVNCVVLAVSVPS